MHIIINSDEIINQKEERKEIIDPMNFIQCAILNLQKDKKFKPHKHIYKKRTYYKQIAQESWYVIKGIVRFLCYDINDELIHEEILSEGDMTFTLLGGHNYEILGKNTRILEFKTGFYEGQKLDKEFI